MSLITAGVGFQLNLRCIPFARGVPALADNFSGPLCSFTVRTAKVLAFVRNTATGRIFTFLWLGHLILLDRDIGAQISDAVQV
jgi:hypothetical protein